MKAAIEKKIIEESKGLPEEKLNEVLDFIQFIKLKNFSKDKISEELAGLDKISLIHLEEEFNNYKELYPYE